MPPSVTWSTLRAQIARKLNDTGMQRYTADLLMDGINDALRAFASTHTGLASDFEITGDGSTYTFDLPSNIVDSEHAGVYAVQWTEQRWLYEEKYWPAMELPSSTRTTSSAPLAYFLWPVGKISFTRVPGNGDTITIHYVAYYPAVTGDASQILVPVWAREAVKLYTCAEALAPGSAKTANLRQYQSRREAGKPEDNPLLVLAKHYLARYEQILASHPLPQYRLSAAIGSG